MQLAARSRPGDCTAHHADARDLHSRRKSIHPAAVRRWLDEEMASPMPRSAAPSTGSASIPGRPERTISSCLERAGVLPKPWTSTSPNIRSTRSSPPTSQKGTGARASLPEQRRDRGRGAPLKRLWRRGAIAGVDRRAQLRRGPALGAGDAARRSAGHRQGATAALRPGDHARLSPPGSIESAGTSCSTRRCARSSSIILTILASARHLCVGAEPMEAILPAGGAALSCRLVPPGPRPRSPMA